MLTTLLAASVMLGQVPAPYSPNGPKIEFTMSNGKSFVITTDPQHSPKTVEHILALVKKHFYDGQRVHSYLMQPGGNGIYGLGQFGHQYLYLPW